MLSLKIMRNVVDGDVDADLSSNSTECEQDGALCSKVEKIHVHPNCQSCHGV